jgi:hypothetical protein
MTKHCRNAAFALLLRLLSLSAFPQQGIPNPPPKDSFVGTWILNVSKSTLPPADSTITIEAEGNAYKITLYVRDEQGREYRSSTVSDMKGEWSQVKRSFSHHSDKWRLTRESSDAFVLEDVVRTDRYTVSSDGKILIDRLLKSNLTTYDGPAHPIPGSVKVLKTTYPVLVYERAN